MKTISIKTILSTFLMVFTFALSSSFAQENTKVEKATSKFCENIDVFASSLDALEAANKGASVDALNTAYNKAVKAWNKLVKSADKLENVEVKESVKSYNKLVDSINKLGKDGSISDDDANQIGSNINDTKSEINAILSSTCK